MTSIRVWAKALRLPFLTATAVPVVLGGAVAYWEMGVLDWELFLLCLIGVSLLHLGTNLANDYFDHKSGNDEANKTPTPFSGGSRAIQQGLIAPKMILGASLGFFLIGISIGLLLYWMTQNVQIIIIGVSGALIGFFYTASPFRLGYRGIGELLTGIGFGPLVVAGVYTVQVGSVSSVAWLASIPVAILVGLILFINEFPDHDADKKTGKRTWVVLLGKGRAVRLYHLLLFSSYAFVLLMVGTKMFPLFALLPLLTLPLAIRAYKVSKLHYNKIRELLPANASTIMIHIVFGVLLSAGFILDKVL